MMAIKNILVSTNGGGADGEVIKLACSLARKPKAKVYAVYIIEVERSLSLDTQVDSETEKAEKILTQAEDAAADADYDVETDLLQARDAGPAIVNEAVERGVDLIIMATTYKKPHGVPDLGKAVYYVLKEAPCRVLLYRDSVS
jgi:nucleotide-binding universal stress UspA family protein